MNANVSLCMATVLFISNKKNDMGAFKNRNTSSVIFLTVLLFNWCTDSVSGQNIHFSFFDEKLVHRVTESDSFYVVLFQGVGPDTANAYLGLIDASGILRRNIIWSKQDTSVIFLGVETIGDDLVLVGQIFARNTNQRRFYSVFLSKKNLSLKKEIYSEPQIGKIVRTSTKVMLDSSLVILCDFSLFRQEAIRIKNRVIAQTKLFELPGAMYTDFAERHDSSGYVFVIGSGVFIMDTAFNTRFQIDIMYENGILLGSLNIFKSSIIRDGDTYIVGNVNRVRRNGAFLENFYFQKFTFINSHTRIRSQTIDNKDTLCVAAFSNCLSASPDRSIYLGGIFDLKNVSIGLGTFFLSKFDRNLNILWSRKYERGTFDLAVGVFATSDSGCIIYGYRYSDVFATDYIAYLLKVDGNGTVVSETSIPMVTPRIAVFPNPSSEFLRIELPSLIGEIDVRIFDAQGKLVFSEKGRSAETPLNIQELASGNYVLQVWQKGQLLGVAQWVKY
jgi:hypothetical protein